MVLTIVFIFTIPPTYEGVHDFLYHLRFAIFLFLIVFGIFYTGLKQDPKFLFTIVFMCFIFFLAPYVVQTLLMYFKTGMWIY